MDTLELPRIDAGIAAAPGSTRPRRRGPRPWRRPPLALRAFTGLLGLGSLVAIAALMLSDRAPGALRTMFGDTAQRISDRIDAAERLPSTDQFPESDFIVHVGLWAGAAVLVGWALWTWRGLFVGAIAVFSASVLIEASQGVYSDTRAVEAHDVAANATGVAIGTAVAGTCYLLWSGMAMLGDRLRRS